MLRRARLAAALVAAALLVPTAPCEGGARGRSSSPLVLPLRQLLVVRRVLAVRRFLLRHLALARIFFETQVIFIFILFLFFHSASGPFFNFFSAQLDIFQIFPFGIA